MGTLDLRTLKICQTESASTTSTGSAEVTKVAGEILFADRVVSLLSDGKIYLFDPTDSAHYGKVLGISKTSAVADGPIVVMIGETVKVGTTLTVGETYFAGAGGILQTTALTSGISQRIGLACLPDTLLLNLQYPINVC